MVNPPYQPLNPGLAAECIYLYYLKITGDPKYETRVFVFKRDFSIAIDAQIRNLATEISAGQHYPCGWNFGDVKWRRKSYMVFILEDNNHSLEAGNAVTFTPDYPFRDGHDVTSLSPPHSGFCCFNHLIRKQGIDLPDDVTEPFYVEINHPHRQTQAVRSHEDSGTNMGPPIGPP